MQNIVNDIPPGLIHSKAGLYLFLLPSHSCYIISSISKIADDLLDKDFKSFSIYTLYLKNMTGIGRGVEYLIQNGFTEGKPEEIIEVVDNKLFLSLNENNPTSFD